MTIYNNIYQPHTHTYTYAYYTSKQTHAKQNKKQVYFGSSAANRNNKFDLYT